MDFDDFFLMAILRIKHHDNFIRKIIGHYNENQLNKGEMRPAAFFKLIRFHGIATTKQLSDKIRHCGVSPGEWAAMFLDKIHAVYREREGGTLIDTENTDPVALTIAGLKPKNGDVRHTHTEAAANLLLEIMADWELGQNDGKTHWGKKLSGPTIAFELDRRKGKRGRIQKEQ